MAQILSGTPKPTWFQHIGKGVAVAASTGAALISILTALFSYGVIGKSESHQSIGNLGAAWVKLRPLVDTATAIGDTIHYAATIADKSGSILVGARPTWTTGDSSIATVGSDGAVVARGPGLTSVSVVVGALVANSQILVKQRVAGVVVSSPAGDTAVVLPEDANLQLGARAVDARGHNVGGGRSAASSWHVDDPSVATVDAKGVLTGRAAGRTVISANIDGASGYMGIMVVTTAAALDPVAGANQRVLAGKVLPQKVVVRATNRRGQPAPGKTVTFRVAEGQGAADPVTTVTDADGRARTTWTLGGDPGRQTLLASVENLDSALAIVAEADPVASNTHTSAVVERLRARAGELLSDSVAIRVTDSTGRALADVPVRWTALDGGSIEAIAPRTDSLGVAHARWTLAKRTGTQRVRAQVGSATNGIAPVTISADALAGMPSAMEVVNGNGQRSPAGSTLPKTIAIRVVDASGNGAADIAVLLSPSGGTLPDTALRTDSLGVAKTRWTLGHSAGDYTLAVHVDGIKKLLKVSARATPAKAANLSFDDVPAPAGDKSARTKTRRLAALVTDIYGNPVPDAPVTFSVKSGAVTPARAVTDAKGRVSLRWLLGAKQGEQTLTGVVRASDVRGAYVTTVGTTDKVRQAGTVKPKR